MVHSKQCVARLFLHYQDWLRIADPVYHSSLHCWLSQYASCEIWGVWGWGWGEVVRRSNISINLVFKKAQSVLDCPGAIVSKFSGCQARTSPQQNWQELSKLQESVAGGRGWPGGSAQYWIVEALRPSQLVARTLCQWLRRRPQHWVLFVQFQVCQPSPDPLSHLSDSPSLSLSLSPVTGKKA